MLILKQRLLVAQMTLVEKVPLTNIEVTADQPYDWNRLAITKLRRETQDPYLVLAFVDYVFKIPLQEFD